MVICRMETTTNSKSRLLSFGMDRILSQHESHHLQHGLSADSGKMTRMENWAENRSRTDIYNGMPSFKLGSTNFRIASQYFPPTIFAPQPLRPFANVIQPDIRGEPPPSNGNSHQTMKRKRSWSRAVFSNLQRKGLEKRFQIQKYITKPDRRQLAATLGLTDAQVKVWFQNRRMKWRHTKQGNSEDKKFPAVSLNNDQSNDQEFLAYPGCDSEIDVQTVDSD